MIYMDLHGIARKIQCIFWRNDIFIIPYVLNIDLHGFTCLYRCLSTEKISVIYMDLHCIARKIQCNGFFISTDILIIDLHGFTDMIEFLLCLYRCLSSRALSQWFTWIFSLTPIAMKQWLIYYDLRYTWIFFTVLWNIITVH